MGNIFKRLLGINYLYNIIPFLLLIIYGPGIIIAFFRIGLSKEVGEFLFLFILSLLSYYLTYFLLSLKFKLRLFITKGISIINFSHIAFALYFLYIIYVCITAPKIPLLQSFLGASSTELAFYRETFFKARTGFDAILVYINAIFTVAVLPFVISSLFVTKNRYRYLYLIFFVFTLFLSLEKSLIARAILPLMVLVVNKEITDKYLKLRNIIFILVIAIIGLTFISLGNFSSSDVQLLKEVIEIDEVAVRYFIVNNPDNSILFMLNRIFWIPYITAIDWLSYFNEILNRNYVWGASSSIISGIFGMERINLERLVFEYEWGQNESGTGSANTVYFIDIFLNFGIVGVILANVILASIVKYFEIVNNVSAKATFYVYAYFLVTSSILAVMFSSGLILFMLMILFVNSSLNNSETLKLKFNEEI